MNPFYSSLIATLDARLLAMQIPQRLGLVAVATPEPLHWQEAQRAGVVVDVLRLDRLHSVISGNKWFKLKYNLLAAHDAGCTRLVSCGGARSNHLHALAYTGHQLGMATQAVVRGEEWATRQNPTLCDVVSWGMALRPASRQQFREWRTQGWQIATGKADYVIPEGGDNFLGVLGCLSLAASIPADVYCSVHVAVGTGCTFLGLRVGLPARVTVVGHAMLKGRWQLPSLQSRLQPWCFGSEPKPFQWWAREQRFGHSDQALQTFISAFEADTGMPLEPVYTGPMFLRLRQQLRAGEITAGTRMLVVHSGGLQGNNNDRAIRTDMAECTVMAKCIDLAKSKYDGG